MNVIKMLDYKFLNGAITTNFRRFSIRKIMGNKSNLRMNIVFTKNEPGIIDILSEKFGSDKGGTSNTSNFPWPHHTYSHVYSMFLSHNRLNVRNLLEVGIGTNNPLLQSSMGENGSPGASLYLWREYFPNATIIGMDIDKEILFADTRIQTYFIDQTKASPDLERFPVQHFDVIIDDGLHTFEANIALFEDALPKLSKSGLYFIEDVRVKDIKKFQTYFRTRSFEYFIFAVHRENEVSTDNNIIVIKGD